MKTYSYFNSLKPAPHCKASFLTASMVAVLAIAIASPANAENTAYGTGALASVSNNILAVGNSAFGEKALHENTAVYNTAVGYWALYHNKTGPFNTAVGDQALNWSNGTGNTAIGFSSLFQNGEGAYNTATGYLALSDNTGSYNTANGVNALFSNTTGGYNAANGVSALYFNTIGGFNTANGALALYKNIEGSLNTANGYQALYKNTTGNKNTANGYQALYKNITGSGNTALGYFADVARDNLSNATAIGYNAKVNASNKVRIGNMTVTVIEGEVSWTSTSDRRLKNNINDLPLGLDFISKLRPVEYIRNNNSEQTKEWGVIAQELRQTLSDVGYKNAGIVTEDSSPEKYLTVRYNDLLALVIKAIQEQDKKIQEQDEKMQDQQKTIAALLNQQNNITALLKTNDALLKRIEALEKK